MNFKVNELEREPIDFDLELSPGTVDLGSEAEQQGPLAASGHAEVLHEHRGPRVAHCPMAGKGFRGVMGGLFDFGNGIAHGDREAGSAQQGNVWKIVA